MATVAWVTVCDPAVPPRGWGWWAHPEHLAGRNCPLAQPHVLGGVGPARLPVPSWMLSRDARDTHEVPSQRSHLLKAPRLSDRGQHGFVLQRFSRAGLHGGSPGANVQAATSLESPLPREVTQSRASWMLA